MRPRIMNFLKKTVNMTLLRFKQDVTGLTSKYQRVGGWEFSFFFFFTELDKN